MFKRLKEDRLLLLSTLVLVAFGLLMVYSASSVMALKRYGDSAYFLKRQAIWAGGGLIAMYAAWRMDYRKFKYASLPALAVMFILLLLVLVPGIGAEINGAKRWIRLAGLSFQPSEFAKPAFVVLSAWLFAESETRTDMPAVPLSILMAVLFAGLLLSEPDVGQTLLITMVWATLFFLSGQPLLGAGIIAACGALGFAFAYSTFEHVRYRVDKFLAPTPGDYSQLDRAIKSFSEGGFLGRGPGEGTIKTVLPDAHTDFIFAVVAEEYGVVACLVLLGLFAFVVMRSLVKAAQEPDAATRLSIQGLALVFGLQALINMGVNVGLLPAKGITLPFVSAGGSSMLAVSITLGMLLALTRRRPDVARLKKPPVLPSVGGLEATVRK